MRIEPLERLARAATLKAREREGYSLPELVILLIIVALALVFVVANWDKLGPKPTQFTITTEKAVVEAVNRALLEYSEKAHAEGKPALYPLELDAAEIGATASEQTPLFTKVLPRGVTLNWKKIGVSEYEYVGAAVEGDKPGEAGRQEKRYSYDAAAGKFVKGTRASSET